MMTAATGEEIEAAGEVIAVLGDGGMRIVVQRTQFKGKDLIDVRKFYDASDLPTEAPKWKPTRKGISIKPEELDAVIDALSQVESKRR